MQLNDYFKQQQGFSTSDIDKLELYQKVLYKRNKPSFTKKTSFVNAKSFFYTVVIIFLLFGLYGIYFNWNIGLNYQWFVIRQNDKNTAQADYIAKIVEFNWTFYIQHNWERLQTSNIWNWDTVILQDWSEMLFDINSWAKAKIVWPAKLILEKEGETDPKYKLSLIQGDFVQLQSTENENQNIELSANNVLIKQRIGSKPMNFQLIKAWDNQIIKNNWWWLLITNTNDENQKTETYLNSKQILTVQENDIKLFDNREKFTTAINSKDISQTFSLSDIDTQENTTNTTNWTWIEKTLPEDIDIPADILSMINDQTIQADQTTPSDVSENLVPILSDWKRVLTPEQNDQLNILSSLMPSIRWTYINFILWNEWSFNDSFNKIENEIAQLYRIFEMKYDFNWWTTSNSKISWLKQVINSLLEWLDNNYNIPPKYTSNLNTIISRLTLINNKGYSSNANIQEVNISRDNLKADLPSNLTFR